MTTRAEARAWIAAEKKKIDDDDRFHYKPALVHVNAPLALIQVAMGARHEVLLEMERLLAPKPRRKR